MQVKPPSVIIIENVVMLQSKDAKVAKKVNKILVLEKAAKAAFFVVLLTNIATWNYSECFFIAKNYKNDILYRETGELKFFTSGRLVACD